MTTKQQAESGSRRRVLVFGGSGAVGRAVCRRLKTDGARVAFTYMTGESVAGELAKELGDDAMALPLDVRSVDDIAAVVGRVGDAFGGLDGFVQCAAVGATKPEHYTVKGTDEAAWDEVLSVNTKSTFFAVRALLEVMNSGNVVVVGSIDGHKPVPAPVHYAASKGALAGMVQALAKELGPQGIRVNLVAPGLLDDGISRTLPEDLKAEYLKHCGLQRFGTADEVANVVAWLALDNTYVTGRSVLLDGAL